MDTKDRAWSGTPLGWALYYVHEAKGDNADKQYPQIAAYLRAKQGHG
jgi:hypothetical protein